MTDAIQKAREALREMIYETTHLSPEEADGAHKCIIPARALSNARSALAALDAETDGWRTMDNAPKNGTRIELWHQSGDVLAGGYSIHGCWRDYQPGVWSWRSDAGALIDAKYWRPVPVPPESRS